MQGETGQDGMGNYWKIVGEGGESYADRLFQHQQIPGFLPFEITWINGQKEYIYDVSGKVTLRQYISKYDITKDTLVDLLNQLMELSDCAQDYLLDGNGVVYEADCIYVDPSGKKISGIYQENTLLGGVKGMGGLIESMIKAMDSCEQEIMFWLYELHRQTKEPGMTRQILHKCIKKQEIIKPKPDIKTDEEFETDMKKIEKTEQSTNELKRYLLPVLMLICGAMIFVVTWLLGCYRQPLTKENDRMMGAGAALFFLGIAGYGAWRTWPEKKQDETIWQDSDAVKTMCLISCQGSIKSIPVTHYPFVLGGDKNKVDGVIGGKGIEQVHAKVLCEGGELYVIDMESRQGTFYNDERLVPWQKQRLQDGDVIRFAQMEYVVEID